MIRPTWNRWDLSFDPFSELRLLERQMNRLFRDVHSRGTDYPSLNFWSNENEAFLEIEMPGVDQNDFELTVADDVVTISGERKDPFISEQSTAHRQERAFGKFSRSLQLPFAVDADKVTARYENGVLRVSLPRHESTKSKRIEVKSA
ncbi:MAG TPA: Hsp20/alpha crystallin family protein [Kiritimatiellia bacterium]|nr:Hsp20/alpha crystallin family protein [Kiritimatiellia bacterium]